MARQTRSERRARRAAQAQSQEALERAPSRPAVRPPVEPAVATQDGTGRKPGFFGRITRFVSESWAELKKVEWPNQQQLVQGTAVVLIACLVVGAYLFLADEFFRRLVQHVLLR